MRTRDAFIVLALLGLVACSLANADGDGDAFEWSGTFATPDSKYIWSAQAVDGEYVDPTMKMVVLPVGAGGSEAELLSKADEAKHSFEEDCEDIEVGGEIIPQEDKCYKLIFMEGSTLDSAFYIVTEGVAHVAIFAEHFPTEFERTDHYLKSLSGSDIEPIAQIPESADGHDHGDHDDDAHDGHDHGEDDGDAFEWSGTFATPDSKYIWSAQAVDGEYADPTMKMVVLPVGAGGSEAELLSKADEAKHSFEEDCEDIEVGGEIIPQEDKCYKLIFMEGSTLDSTFYIVTEGVAHVAIFAEHFPTEFERTDHYLKSLSGSDIEPIAQTPSDDKPWGTAIGAAIIVNIVTLLGIVLLVPAVHGLVKTYPVGFAIVCNAFAAGALLGAAVFLMLHEATHLITADTEAEASAAWGCMILLGFITSFLLDFVTIAIAPELGNPPPAPVRNIEDIDPKKVFEPMSTPQATEQALQPNQAVMPFMQPGPAAVHPGMISMQPSATGGMPMPYGNIAIYGRAFGILEEQVDEKDSALASRRHRVLSGVLVGDFMHNFCDGIFIGAAFAQCNSSVGWSVTAATVYHEMAQELSDFVVLTDPEQGGLKPLIALILNFVSGMSVIIGVIVALSADLTNYETGMILAYGGGVYVQIAAAECMPRIYANARTLSSRFMAFAAFFIGATAIGLVLLDHLHCSAGGAHDGHNH